jgi:hypothetical protein
MIITTHNDSKKTPLHDVVAWSAALSWPS